MKTVYAKPINSTNVLGKKRKKPKASHKKDDENILSKDIDVDEEMKVLERMGEKKILKPREELAQSSFTLKNLKFKPQKYKGNYLPYHLRWIFNNNVKSNEIVLIHEIEALENEINRLKKLKLINRECRKIANLPFGVATNICQCCHKLERKKHECTHQFCGEKCAKKKAEEIMMNLVSAQQKIKETEEKVNPVNPENAMTIPSNENNAGEIRNIPTTEFNKIGEKSLFGTKSEGNEDTKTVDNNASKSKILFRNGKELPLKLFGTIDRDKERKALFLVKNDGTY